MVVWRCNKCIDCRCLRTFVARTKRKRCDETTRTRRELTGTERTAQGRNESGIRFRVSGLTFDEFPVTQKGEFILEIHPKWGSEACGVVREAGENCRQKKEREREFRLNEFQTSLAIMLSPSISHSYINMLTFTWTSGSFQSVSRICWMLRVYRFLRHRPTRECTWHTWHVIVTATWHTCIIIIMGQVISLIGQDCVSLAESS